MPICLEGRVPGLKGAGKLQPLILLTKERFEQVHIGQDILAGVCRDYTVKKVGGFPVPGRDVTYQTLPGRE